MRLPFFVILLVMPVFAGCADDQRQWAGIAEAWQYEDSSIVEVQLHRGRAGMGADDLTARAGMGRVTGIESAIALVTMRDGRVVNTTLEGWVFDRANDTASAPLALTGFDKFALNVTFQLEDGSLLNSGDLASWTEQFRRPYYATLRVSPREGETSLTLSLYKLEHGARELTLDGLGQNGTLRPVNITRVDAWRVSVEASNGTDEDTTQPTIGRSTLTVRMPRQGVTQAEPRYTLLLADGSSLTDRDVDNDVYPESLALERRIKQEN